MKRNLRHLRNLWDKKQYNGTTIFLFRLTGIIKCLVIIRLQEVGIFEGKFEGTTRSKQRTGISGNVILLECHLIKMKRLNNLIISIIYIQISQNGFLLR